MIAKHSSPAPTEWEWLPDDTEESVVGTPLHQKAISILADMLEALRDDEGASWDIGRNLGIRGFTRRDGSAYTPMPDVLVHPRRLPENEAEISLAEYGPPVLVVEIASPSTVAADIGEKAATYARGGVQEYLVFDVGGRLLGGERVRAWHQPGVSARGVSPLQRGSGLFVPWLPQADGRWYSVYGFSLAAEGPLLRVYTGEGRAQPTMSEQRRRLQTAEHERRAAEHERLAAEHERRAAEDRAQQEAQARRAAERERQAAEQRIVALEAELRRLRDARDPNA